MKTIRFESVFFNPLMLLCLVMYWYSSMDRSHFLLSLLIILQILIYVFDLRKRAFNSKNTYLRKENLELKELFLYVLTRRVKNRKVIREVNIVVELVSILLICSIVMASLKYEIGITISAILCFFAPFAPAMLLNNTPYIQYYIESK